MGQRGERKVRGDWKVRGGQLIPRKGPECGWGFTTMSKTLSLTFQVSGVFSVPFNARGYAQSK
jgi:hypothetical protein